MKEPKRIVVLTGSGVSAESGIATFRDKDGLWARYDWRQLATPAGFAGNPERVHEFYNGRRRNLRKVAPNAAHVALAALESRLKAKGGELTLVTQNVDDLHERAGSRNLIHMHGELTRVRCAHCGEACCWRRDLTIQTACPGCGSTGGMRPDVVWFGEIPLHLDVIAAALAAAEHFASIGTSGAVYPAAGFAAEARSMNIPCTELNLEPSENAWVFTDGRYGKASEIVPQWAAEICP